MKHCQYTLKLCGSDTNVPDPYVTVSKALPPGPKIMGIPAPVCVAMAHTTVPTATQVSGMRGSGILTPAFYVSGSAAAGRPPYSAVRSAGVVLPSVGLRSSSTVSVGIQGHSRHPIPIYRLRGPAPVSSVLSGSLRPHIPINLTRTNMPRLSASATTTSAAAAGLAVPNSTAAAVTADVAAGPPSTTAPHTHSDSSSTRGRAGLSGLKSRTNFSLVWTLTTFY